MSLGLVATIARAGHRGPAWCRGRAPKHPPGGSPCIRQVSGVMVFGTHPPSSPLAMPLPEAPVASRASHHAVLSRRGARCPPGSLVGSRCHLPVLPNWHPLFPLSCGFLALLLRPCSHRLLRNPSLIAGMLCAFCPISLPPFLPTHVHFISVLLQDPFSGCLSLSPLNGETSLVLNPQASSENGWSCLQSIKMEARPCLKNNLPCFKERHFSLLLLPLSFIIFKPHMISY